MSRTIRKESHKPYNKESGYVRKRTRRQARVKAAQALANEDFENEHLYLDTKGTEGWETW